MTVLVFWHNGWEVATAAWSASAKPGKSVIVCYQWGADGVSFFESATGIRQVEFAMTMNDFFGLIARGGVVDMRKFQSA